MVQTLVESNPQGSNPPHILYSLNPPIKNSVVVKISVYVYNSIRTYQKEDLQSCALPLS